jgi:hypothetical protein
VSRIGYSDGEDYPGQFELWRSNMGRSLRGKRGVQALRDLLAALSWLPEKRLIRDHLVRDGDFCATGALVAYRIQAKDPTLDIDAAAKRVAVYIKPNCAQCGDRYGSHLDGPCTDCPARIERHREYRRNSTTMNSLGLPYAFEQGPTLWDSICQEYVQGRVFEDDADEEGVAEDAAVRHGVPRMVAWAIVEQNDGMEFLDSDKRTPEQRYDDLLQWTRTQLSRAEHSRG